MKRVNGFIGICVIALAAGWWLFSDDSSDAPAGTKQSAPARDPADGEFRRANWDTRAEPKAETTVAKDETEPKPARFEGTGVVTFVDKKSRDPR